MKIKYLGTAAAEGIPAVFCECENCKKAMKLGGKNIRTRSQAIIDDALLIDFPADTYMHYLKYNIPLYKIKNCIITHSHQDHLYADEILLRKKHFSHLSENERLVFYSAQSGYEILKEVADEFNIEEVKIVLIKPFESFEADEYKITPLKASHDINSSPVIFIIEKGDKSILYSNDTSEYCDETNEYLKNVKKPFDLISLDCTEACNHVEYVGHLSLERCVAMRDKFIEDGIADEKTIFVLNHFSHNGAKVNYDEFMPIAKSYGFLTSYDGMEIEI